MPSIFCLTHTSHEGPGLIEDWAQETGLPFHIIPVYNGSSFPEPEPSDGIVVMGGPMNIYDDQLYPWLIKEKLFLTRYISNGNKILGICLGAQLLADRLGARVTGNEYPEIGWFDINWSNEALKHPYFSDCRTTERYLHWHGDTFEIPPGSLHLASSEVCKNQGFLWNSQVLGLQFHPEIAEEALRKMIMGNKSDLEQNSPYIQSEEQIINGSGLYCSDSETLFKLLDRFINKRDESD